MCRYFQTLKFFWLAKYGGGGQFPPCPPPCSYGHVIVVLDDEIEARSRSSLCVQKRNENDSDI